MKKTLTTLFLAIAMVSAFAADKIFLHSGKEIDGKVIRVEEFIVVFKYEGEDAEQTIGKKAVDKIQYSSGRSETISEKIVIIGKEDWEKVEILLDKSEIIGLKKLGDVKGKSTGGFSGSKSDKKANKKLLESAAEMGAPFVYMMSESKSSGGGWGGYGGGIASIASANQSLKKGIAFTYEENK
ncbi:MAG TPA: hypothetical protein PLJ42_08595 [Chitinophagales bacterium]|jgi:sRNA-binding regulator protein Hfq|nr:hypothetical protein [Chitinophagales bacterium]MBP6154030.1 hypothetical protein [Chitinophagales bacterium]HQV78328.1 hypothetical protein [Chitinophagales bacterium]HQW79479.1 hypothetical protein [Chitinophagales bacterium]